MDVNKYKSFLLSKTVWSLIISLLAMILANTDFGKALTDSAAQEHLVDTILQVVAGIFTLLGIFFRVNATERLT